MGTTTPGRLLLEAIIPPQFHKHIPSDRSIGSGEIKSLLQEVAVKDPSLYRDISHKLLLLGSRASSETSSSFNLKDLQTPINKAQVLRQTEIQEQQIFNNKALTPQQRDNELVKLYGKLSQDWPELIYNASLSQGSNLAKMVASGARGNKGQLNSNIGADWLMVDANSNPIPVGIKHNYAEGLSPEEYAAASFGVRRGLISTKFATADSGFLSKKLTAAASDLVVTDSDCETTRGIPVPAEDRDNIGGVLAKSIGGVPAGTIITPATLRDFKHRQIDQIVLRSPMTCQAKGGGICAHCAGVRERGGLPPVMDNVGVAAASALSEPLSQGALSEKHTGGVASGSGKSQSIFNRVEALVEAPEIFPYGATVAEKEGPITDIQEAPQGGKFVFIGPEKHYISPQLGVKVKVGDRVEAGDALSEGIVNPSDVVRHKGIGAGRMYFVEAVRNAFKDGGLKVNRRNLEILSRSIINHVRISDPEASGEHLPDDVVEYHRFERAYRPRNKTTKLHPQKAVGQYLEKPVLHYSVGTKITPRVAEVLHSAGEKEIEVGENEPTFEPEMIRLMDNSSHKTDWMAQLGGSYLKKNLLKSVHQGDASSDIHGINFQPALAHGVEFGRPPKGRIGY